MFVERDIRNVQRGLLLAAAIAAIAVVVGVCGSDDELPAGGPYERDVPAADTRAEESFEELRSAVMRAFRDSRVPCPIANEAGKQLDFALRIDVEDGKLVKITLDRVYVGADKAEQRLTIDELPVALRGLPACVAPLLGRLSFAPPPEDGSYQIRFVMEPDDLMLPDAGWFGLIPSPAASS